MWAQYVAVAILVAMSREVWGRETCGCSHIEHPQYRFCLATTQFAYRVDILFGGSLPSGIPSNNYDYWKYIARVDETFKGEEYLPQDGSDTVDIYTPDITLCGRMQLYDSERESNEYLVTGTVEMGFNETRHYLAITACTWVVPWESLTPQQIEGLRGGYQPCDSPCFATPVSTGLLSNEPARFRFQVQDCLYNPVTASRLKVDDCETMYGFCEPDTSGDGCHWRSTNAYMDCYNSRRASLSHGAKPAIAVKQDCRVYTGRKKKMCLLKFLKAQQRARRNH